MALSLQNVLTDISFCDKQCSNVNDNATKNRIIQHLDTKFGIQVIDRSFIVLNPHIIKNVIHHPHIVATISAGNYYLLWLTKIDGIQCCLYIDRKLKNGYFYPKIHCVRYRFADEIFDDTIVIGELVRDIEKRWLFLLSDILLHKGQKVRHLAVHERFKLMHTMLETQYTPDPSIECCPIQVKKLFMYHDLQQVVKEFIPSLTYPCRGIMFYTQNSQNNDYAYLFSREHEIPLKSADEIDTTLRELCPHLYQTEQVNDDTTPPIMDSQTLESAFEIIYGDEYKAELYGSVINKVVKNPTELAISTVSTLDELFADEDTYSQIQNSSIQENLLPETTEKLEEGQVVMKIVKTPIPDIYNLYWNNKGEMEKAGVASVPNLKTSKFLAEMFANVTDILNIHVITTFNTKNEKWSIVKRTTLPVSSKTF